jgi:ABC-type transport system involved in multi-copper enzyme maturation permease subunit
MLGIIVLLLAGLAVGTAHSNHKITPATRAAARVEATDQIATDKQQLADCTAAQAAGNVSPASPYFLPPGATCEDFYGDHGYTPTAANFLPPTWIFARDATNMLLIFGVIFALFGFAVGASSIGAEWSSGGMSNLLLWRPRRLATLGGKLAALLLAVLVCGLLFLALWVGLLCGLAGFRGSFGHLTSGLLTSMALAASRSIALGLAMTAIGFAIASIGRNTASALGIAVGYIVVIEAGGMVVARLLHIARPERFLLSRYVAAWLYQKQSFSVDQVCSSSHGGFVQVCGEHQWTMRMGSAAEVVGILTAALLAWAFIAIRRRDVT